MDTRVCGHSAVALQMRAVLAQCELVCLSNARSRREQRVSCACGPHLFLAVEAVEREPLERKRLSMLGKLRGWRVHTDRWVWASVPSARMICGGKLSAVNQNLAVGKGTCGHGMASKKLVPGANAKTCTRHTCAQRARVSVGGEVPSSELTSYLARPTLRTHTHQKEKSTCLCMGPMCV
jgi:hypothetical protein